MIYNRFKPVLTASYLMDFNSTNRSDFFYTGANQIAFFKVRAAYSGSGSGWIYDDTGIYYASYPNNTSGWMFVDSTLSHVETTFFVLPSKTLSYFLGVSSQMAVSVYNCKFD